MSTPENPPAFPSGENYATTDYGGNVTRHSKAALKPGMSLRDYFAAKAMAAELNMWHHPSTGVSWSMSKVAASAYEMADAMLAARNRAGEEGRS